MTRLKVVQRVPRRVPIADVYGVPDAGRFLNVALLHATPDVDVGSMKEAVWARFVERTNRSRK
jgi:hypothetical protein